MNIRKILAPSTIITNTIDALKRFPFVLMATIYLGYLLRVLNYSKSQQTELAFECLAVSLAVPLLVAAASLRESFKKSSWFIFADLIVLLIPIVFLMSSDISYLEKNVFRYLLLLASAHLLVAFAPFLIFKSETAFWEFNKRLFLRFLLSSLYSGILYIGIALILSVLEFLFHVTTGQIYLDAFLVCALIFQPLHFLSSFPKDVRSLEHDHAYPRGLKIFCQNLLLPLTA